MAALPPPTTTRPTLRGTRYMASTGHPLATAAAIRILEAGGTAIDAGVAAGLCLNVVLPQFTNLGGVAPIVLHSARDQAVRSISGLGCWPAAVDIDYFREECAGTMPPGVQRCVVPAAVDAWLTALEQFGTKTLREVAAPAIELAQNGFHIDSLLQANFAGAMDTMQRWPSSAAIYWQDGRPPIVGERLVQRDLATTLELLIDAETDHRHLGRERAIRAARDRFYRGDIAERMTEFVAAEGGFLSLEDLHAFSVDVESPPSVTYRGYDVFGCGPWCQGPVALEALSILEGYDLAAMSPAGADVFHLTLEALKAGFADREYFYSDPKFVDVPIHGLLSRGYAEQWRARIDRNVAAPEMPIPGDPWAFEDRARPARSWIDAPQAKAGAMKADTSYLCVVDADGNAFSATPSDGIGESPVVPGLGFAISDRGVQSRLDPDHPSVIAPGKRPRLTPSPGLIMRNGRVFAPYGTPGGDVQPQAMVQLVINLIDFGMDPQASIEAPRLASYSFPESFYPFPYRPGLVMAESRIPDDVIEDLRRRGHEIELWPEWSAAAGALCTVVVDETNRALLAAADPRRTAYAMGW
ncbi:MAG: gamma-glutamyltransferase family protein [Thermomicrobiales bacterium]